MTRMLDLQVRASDSPYLDLVWRSVAAGGPMASVAGAHQEIVVWGGPGAVEVEVRGPETRPATLDVPAGLTAVGIVLAHGTSMPHLPAPALVDATVPCPSTAPRRFVLRGEEWAAPAFDDAELLVERLVRAGVLRRDPLVDDVLRGGSTPITARSRERRIRAATGLNHRAIAQIERARAAAVLLSEGRTPLEVVGLLDYHDHPHLAHAMVRFVGRSASGLRARDVDVSLAYKADAPARS
ncbi:AraC family transcriptional regulator [Actinomycetospora lutea]|uniref:AraC family transcriptional regulator n=1 Tax=Actinomycetospora lutea TaxID=663604 RepID=UPI0023669740|nr:AraC family transcriptional regulator [Actinomycetospora lutea]MDD7941730.1 AraC family transcriptional regulator [Actinomycetospora lutea]